MQNYFYLFILYAYVNLCQSCALIPEGGRTAWIAEKTGKEDMLETEENKFLYDVMTDGGSYSVYPSVSALTEVSPALAVPEVEHDAGMVFSVSSSSDNGMYRWLKPTGSYFTKVLITVTSRLVAAWKPTVRFVRKAVRQAYMSLVIRRTVCLRL